MQYYNQPAQQATSLRTESDSIHAVDLEINFFGAIFKSPPFFILSDRIPIPYV